MNTNYENFIGVYDNILSKEECGHVISQFNLIELNENKEIVRGDTLYESGLNRLDFSLKSPEEVKQLIGNRLHKALLNYCEHYFVVQTLKLVSCEVKLQRTPSRGGYHIWHCEQDCLKYANRVLAWTIYLNDIPHNEGETEFLWQGVRVNPKAGRCAIWPAAFTHTHRGNPVYTHDKYIATGWYTLME